MREATWKTACEQSRQESAKNYTKHEVPPTNARARVFPGGLSGLRRETAQALEVERIFRFGARPRVLEGSGLD